MVPPLKALLVDLSGTLHVSDKATPGAVDAITALRESGVELRWVSNTSKDNKQDLLNRVHALGLDVREEELFTSLSAVSKLVRDRNLNPLYILSSSAIVDFPEATPPYDSVVVGLAPEKLDYSTLNEAFRILSTNKDAPLIATHKAVYFRDGDEKLSLGPGPFVSALEEASGVKAEIVGKPSEAFFRLALESLEHQSRSTGGPATIGMIGDDYRQDVGPAAAQLGLYRMLVKTGKYRQGDETRGEREPPEWCGKDFATAAPEIVEARRAR